MNTFVTWVLGPLLAVGLHLAPPLGALPAFAQAPADTIQARSTLGELRDRVEARYRVLPVREGIVLIPTVGEADVQAIELARETIALDGQPVTAAELRQVVGEDADDIVRLSFLDPGERRVLFGLGELPDPAVGPADAAPTTEAKGESAVDDADDEDEEGRSAARVDVDVDASDGDRVRIGGSVRVHTDEVIDGDVVAVGGSARVDGRVRGDVVAVAGSVRLGPDARIDGDVVSVGGSVERAPGSSIGGTVEEVDFGLPAWSGRPHFQAPPVFEGLGGLVSTTATIVFLMLLAALVHLVAAGPVERMERNLEAGVTRAALVGLVAQLLFLPALALITILLVISIIGIPLLIAIPFALLALIVGTLAGFTAVAKWLGRAAEERFGWAHANPYITIAVGVGLVMAASFFGSALGLVGGPLDAFSIVLQIIGFLVQYAAWTIGFGVLVLRLFEVRRNGRSPAHEAPPATGGTPAPTAGGREGAPGEGPSSPSDSSPPGTEP